MLENKGKNDYSIVNLALTNAFTRNECLSSADESRYVRIYNFFTSVKKKRNLSQQSVNYYFFWRMFYE